ncbi:hypothetical protein SAMN04488012_103316 [Palleronia salina]|uniref:Uncharacterized protein n=1 Tax=Palleronia salina TaxID=313368 RepID=A0A1M6F2T4_9RHOB|nr:hypothetical protein [Palleronia salina]SHI91975.1 hypothetical protein SAMN04488012_103316 [Palleronia salina]
MAIKSHAFGRVTLTNDDAEKFSRQVKYGRPTKTAKESVARGLELTKKFKEGGKVSFKSYPREEKIAG